MPIMQFGAEMFKDMHRYTLKGILCCVVKLVYLRLYHTCARKNF